MLLTEARLKDVDRESIAADFRHLFNINVAMMQGQGKAEQQLLFEAWMMIFDKYKEIVDNAPSKD